MRREFAWIAILLFAAFAGAGVRTVASSRSVGRFVCYYRQVSNSQPPATFWERVADSVMLTRASSKGELALY